MSEQETLTRRTLVRRAGAAGVAIAGGTLWATAPAAARARRYGKVQSPLRHVVISCQENRSFAPSSGSAPRAKRGGSGPPRGSARRAGGGPFPPPLDSPPLEPRAPPHSWSSVHRQWNNGAMDGFY